MKARILLSGAFALVALSLVGVSANAGSGGDGPQAQAAAVVKVRVGDNFFSPTKAKVNRGDKVKWKNNGKVDHNVTFSGGGFRSGNFGPGESVKATFARAGKFAYTCTIHPGMNGKVKVVK
jgi:plastocyanin